MSAKTKSIVIKKETVEFFFKIYNKVRLDKSIQDLTLENIVFITKSNYYFAKELMSAQFYILRNKKDDLLAATETVMELLEDNFIPQDLGSEVFDDVEFFITEQMLDDFVSMALQSHPLYKFYPTLRADLEEMLVEIPSLYFEYKQGNLSSKTDSISDTYARDLFNEKLAYKMTGVYQKYEITPDMYQARVNEALWLNSCPENGVTIHEETLTIAHRMLGKLNEQLKQATYPQFVWYLTQYPELLRAVFFLHTQVRSFTKPLLMSKEELDVFFGQVDSLNTPEDFEGADLTFSFDDEIVEKARTQLEYLLPHNQAIKERENLIKFLKLNFDFYLEWVISDNSKICKTFIERHLPI
ncbi:hypothetical protein [Vibrio vulnificus]|uniref:hypothetical protein n=2 Tax=Vibrio TaxID=662 RepID=UPI003242620C